MKKGRQPQDRETLVQCSGSSSPFPLRCHVFRFVLGKTVKLGKQLQDGDTVSNGPAALQALLDGADIQVVPMDCTAKNPCYHVAAARLP
ncbi:hypothetical protein DUNSADRAFT_6463 [Dunaliella salina]|uniref:Encoded protein n=1 Tax=Dunaliella salina TaxID=3046 RepID=A0ABQ7GNC2_DUNSA|nr:hypothetical protein DUNSADRAFT_6463 [Dunaliella salina]|eukprot:KAF5836092.1 hypothetical protein DUNSADRAFT_6463 [Dunaliella salina]